MQKRLLLLSALLAIGTTELFLATPKVDAQARVFNNATATATATAGAATLNNQSGAVTSESLTTAAGAAYALTLTNDRVVGANTVVFAAVANGSNTAGSPVVSTIKTAAGSVVISIQNAGAAAFNGTLVIKYTVLAP
jgi:hypothetical protein